MRMSANSNTRPNFNSHHPVSYPVFSSPNNLSYSPSTAPNLNHLSAYQTTQSFAGQSNVSNLQNQNKIQNDFAHSTAKKS